MIPLYIKENKNDGKKYTLLETIIYTCPRTGRTVTCKNRMRSDGATGAIDIRSSAWWFHDKFCNTGKWDNGDRVSNWEASAVLARILRTEHDKWNDWEYWEEWRWARSVYWFCMTFAFGGGKARKNGMFKVKNENDIDDWPTGVAPV